MTLSMSGPLGKFSRCQYLESAACVTEGGERIAVTRQFTSTHLHRKRIPAMLTGRRSLGFPIGEYLPDFREEFQWSQLGRLQSMQRFSASQASLGAGHAHSFLMSPKQL